MGIVAGFGPMIAAYGRDRLAIRSSGHSGFTQTRNSVAGQVALVDRCLDITGTDFVDGFGIACNFGWSIAELSGLRSRSYVLTISSNLTFSITLD